MQHNDCTPTEEIHADIGNMNVQSQQEYRSLLVVVVVVVVSSIGGTMLVAICS